MIDLLPFTAENVETVPICNEEILMVVPDETLKKAISRPGGGDKRKNSEPPLISAFWNTAPLY